jgi:uncharacterized ferritin-like protein (DUF455 family)
MELKEFAELILFGTNIASDKLLNPDVLTDNKTYQAIIAPKEPGRPKGLQFNENLIAKKIPFPNKHQLEDARQRGYVLHFFANHELLAMEIMALVLLLFPEAPKSFRMGIAKTIIEEQKHMSLYLKRMEQLNVSFGEIPVNDFFWNCLSKMKSPFDFVTKMSMTFEQANIDYSLYYKDLMIKINDYETANILETVYQEEIGHVKHGVTWFNRWRDHSETEWESYVNSLELPLNPARAKGLIFDMAARKSAGLSDEYIMELSVFSSSKGRPPNIYYFNPACEQEIVRGSVGFTPSKSILNLQNDCASLLQFIAAKDDIVLTSQKPGLHFLKKIQTCGFTLPEWMEFNKNSINVNSIPQNYISFAQPWGWSPESLNLMKAFIPKLIGKSSFQENIFDQNFYNNKIKPLYSKAFSAELIYKIKNNFENIKELMPLDNTLPTISNNLENTKLAIQKYLTIPNINMVVLKAPFGCSGQNMKRVNTENLNSSEINWLKRIFKEQFQIIIEPWFEKVVDLSYQSKISENKTTIPIGITRFITDSRGQYKATFVGKKTDDLPDDLTKFIYSRYENYSGIEDILKRTSILVSDYLNENMYEGAFGIDSFIYKDSNSKFGYRLKFLSEINPRFTMGRVAIEISKRIQTGAFAIWAHIRITDILKNDFPSIPDFTQFIENKFPIKLSESPKPLIKEGILFTNDPSMATSVLTILIVGKNILSDFTKLTGIDIIK